MPEVISAKLDASKRRFALVVSRFNEFITAKLIEGAVDAIVRLGGEAKQITQVWVPGSFEIPLAAAKIAESDKFDAVICLGCLIRGQTAHFEHIAAECVRGIAHVAQSSGKPITLGVITADTLEQAIDRAGGKHGNKGADAALAAIEMANLLDALP
ncbi:MAG: 6,7-dimethyl-8-ribityllumazine synthase [Phycisphaerae bacterium]